jgi:hypothetical protein
MKSKGGTAAIHRHIDKSMGEHYDIRLSGSDGDGIYFSTRPGFPEHGKTYMWFEREDHSPDHSQGFYGDIPEDQSGAGHVEHIGNHPVTFDGNQSKDSIDMRIHDGDHAGKYSLRRIADKNWLVRKHKEEAVEPVKKEAFLDPLILAAMYPMASRIGMVAPINDQVYDPIVGYPAPRQEEDALSKRIRSAVGAVGRGVALGAGFAVGGRASNSIMDWIARKKEAAEQVDDYSDITKPAIAFSAKPAGFKFRSFGHHNDD